LVDLGIEDKETRAKEFKPLIEMLPQLFQKFVLEEEKKSAIEELVVDFGRSIIIKYLKGKKKRISYEEIGDEMEFDDFVSALGSNPHFTSDNRLGIEVISFPLFISHFLYFFFSRGLCIESQQ